MSLFMSIEPDANILETFARRAWYAMIGFTSERGNS